MSGEETVYQPCNKEKCEGRQRGALSAELWRLLPFVNDSRFTAFCFKLWYLESKVAWRGWQKVNARVGMLAGRAHTGFRNRNINICTITTDNTVKIKETSLRIEIGNPEGDALILCHPDPKQKEEKISFLPS